jgi:hypothetical protein
MDINLETNIRFALKSMLLRKAFMKEKVAIATVSGKAYFYLVCELKKRNIPFFSLVPGQPIPAEVKVVITTEKEKPQINHQKVLIYTDNSDLDRLISRAVRILQGIETYNRLTIGIDPGEVMGFAVIADGTVIDTENCFNIKDTLKKIERVLRDVDLNSTTVTIKIGNGFPECRDELLEALDNCLPPETVIEVVSEAGTNRPIHTHRRGVRDIVSAIRIAGRSGHIYHRGKSDEPNG